MVHLEHPSDKVDILPPQTEQFPKTHTCGQR